jgi:5,10-methenyltetrahydrofolate synthetase
MDLAAWRRETRARLIEARGQIPAEQHQAASLAIEGFLETVLAPLPPQRLSAYWPFKGEVDLRALLERLEARGWTLALPSVVGRGKPLEFLRWQTGVEMDAQVFGIPVPRVREIVLPDIIIMPLVGFDALNYRLGYGAGYFDITLAGLQPSPRTIGTGFEVSRLETIQPLPTDIPVDLIITEAGIQRRIEPRLS